MYLMLDSQVELRDEVRLSADIYLPASEGQFPVLLCRTPYDKGMELYVKWASRFVRKGYGVVLQDCRGRYASEGHWRPYTVESLDGHDSVEWVARQAWCDGNVGMFGISYVGFTQMLAAVEGSQHLRAIMPTACQQDNFGHIWVDGVLQLQNAVNFFQIGRRTMHPSVPDQIDMDQVYRTLPISDSLNEVSQCDPFIEFLSHPTFDRFWSDYSLEGQYSKIGAATCLLTGWFDNLLHEQFKIFAGLRNSSPIEGHPRIANIVVGPWTHFEIGQRIVGDIDFGVDAMVDIPKVHLEWFDQQFSRGSEQGGGAPIKLFVMGDDSWREEWDWPLARTQWTKLYLASEGEARTANGNGRLEWDGPDVCGAPKDDFRYDPLDPAPTWGGQSMFLSNTGPRSREEIEKRSDVLVYTTGPLARDLEITGPIKLVLFAASSTVDTDFTGTLVNVSEAGSFIVTEGIVRGRYRESVVSPSLLTPGNVYRYEIDLWETSQVFHKGHCIRIEVSSSNFPRYDRNLNTGEPIGFSWESCIARQQIFHDLDHPSYLLLPIIPR